MKKLVALGAAALAVPAAIGAAALFTSPVAMSEPASVAALDVVGEPYARAMAILKSQGVKGSFGGSVGSDLPQAQCIVDSQKVNSGGKMTLMLNCTTEAARDAAGSAAAAPAAPGAAAGPVAPGAGQGTYGGPVGVPVPVG